MSAAPSSPPSASMDSTLHLSALLGRPVTTRSGPVLGRVDDVIVRLRGSDLPLVTGLVLKVSGRQLFLPAEQVEDWNERQPQVRSARLDLRPFERRPGEVLLKVDVLGHRLIDVTEAVLVRASDLELTFQAGQLVLSGVDTRPRRRLFGLLKGSGGHPRRDWKAFEALIGHEPSALVRGPFGRLRRLKPAQLADLPGGGQPGGVRGNPQRRARRPRAGSRRVRRARRGRASPAAI